MGETKDQPSSGRLAGRENVQRTYGEMIKINAELKRWLHVDSVHRKYLISNKWLEKISFKSIYDSTNCQIYMIITNKGIHYLKKKKYKTTLKNSLKT